MIQNVQRPRFVGRFAPKPSQAIFDALTAFQVNVLAAVKVLEPATAKAIQQAIGAAHQDIEFALVSLRSHGFVYSTHHVRKGIIEWKLVTDDNRV